MCTAGGGHSGFFSGLFFFVSTLLVSGRYGRYICVKEIGGLGERKGWERGCFVVQVLWELYLHFAFGFLVLLAPQVL